LDRRDKRECGKYGGKMEEKDVKDRNKDRFHKKKKILARFNMYIWKRSEEELYMVNHYSSLQRILVAIMATMEGVRSYGYV
jgi:hypothetical protein